MKVRCISCGRDVELQTKMDRCPYCKRPATDSLKALAKQQRAAGQAKSAPPEEDLEPNPLADALHEPAEEAPRYEYRPRGTGIEKRIAKWVFITIASIIAIVMLVDYVRTKVSQIIDRHRAQQQQAVAVAPQAGAERSAAPEPQPQPTTPEEPAPSPIPNIPTTKTRAATRAVMFHPVPAPVDPNKKPLTDRDIKSAIGKGITFLLTQFADNGVLKQVPEANELPGLDALCVLALLHAAQSTGDPRLPLSGTTVTAMLEQLKQFDMDRPYATYSRSLRIGALAVHNRPADRDAIKSDVAYLLKSAHRGAFDYFIDPNRKPEQPQPWDNSNTQYGQMGLWLAAESGALVPAAFWADAQKHWIDCQNDNGGFEYQQKGSNGTLAMTAAGLTMMLVADEQVYGDSWASTTRPKQATEVHDAIGRAINWISTDDRCLKIAPQYYGYTLYGLERAGLASGFRFFGKHDWYAELAQQLLKNQQKDGSWTGTTGLAGETAFAMLFLSRGRHPVMMNKLMFDGTWANRPRDAAHLARFTSRELERPLNWAVVGIDNDWQSWTDCPILYIASHEAPQFKDDQLDKLRNYAQAGGIILTHADNGADAFNVAARGLAAKLFPQYPLQALPENHLLYSIGFPVQTKFPLEAVFNGTRILMIHSPTDISKMWQRHDPNAYMPAFRLGANLFVYATGKEQPRQRLDSAASAEPPAKTIGTIPIARLKYNGNWDPEPAAWSRLARIFGAQTSIGLSVHPLDLAAISAGDARLAHLTGTDAVTFDDKQLHALRQYVDDGGVLLIDACGGARAFADSIKAALGKTFDQPPAALTASHPILAGDGEGMDDLTNPLVRSYAVMETRAAPPPMVIYTSGSGAAIFSELDLTEGWLGTGVWGILGYDPEYAQNLAKNIILWTVNERGGN